ncbi:MAG: fumarate/nitrate reduction transcriptional regulator Fnr [Gammaproteobacteria bacterium]|nr:fumarate/nitrate reduction transcriptional regulator Fnr [Gammaproteobacteria bacterium]
MSDKVVELSKIKVACKDCSLFQLCLPMGLESDDLEKLDVIIKRRRPVKRGEDLFRVGDGFRSIYAVRSGSIKTFSPTQDGQEQVTGFHLTGELLGLDAISNNYHPCTATALETTSVCEIPFERLEELGHQIPSLQRQLFRVMSREIFTEENHTLLLGKRNAEERLAAFLLSVSNRFKSRGFSPNEYNLSMSRNDIGNYLGLAVETVSRMFTRFQESGLLTVERKHVVIHDLDRLHDMAGSSRSSGNTRSSG